MVIGFIRLGGIKMEILYFIIIMVIGLFNVLSPETAWYLSHGWRFKDAEPSDLALSVHRVTGAGAMIIGILLIVLRFGSCVSTNAGKNELISSFNKDNIKSVSVTYDLRRSSLLNESQIEEFIRIMNSGIKIEVPNDKGGSSRSGSYFLDAEVSFKDGTVAAFSTLNDNFDFSFEGRNYTFRSSELARFLIGTVPKE